MSLASAGYTHFFPDYLAQCKQCIDTYQLQNHVTFHGFSDDIKTILQSADILLSLSTYESFPSSIKEAMAAGVLVVATPAGGIAELIIDGTSGILCSDISVEMMIDGIRRALALSPAQRQQIVNQARRVARSELHPDRAANDLFTMYNRAIDITRGENQANNQPGYKPKSIQSQFPISRGAPIAVRRLKDCLYYYATIGYDNWAGLSVYVMAGRAETSLKGILRLAIFSVDDQEYNLSQHQGLQGEILGGWGQLKRTYQALQRRLAPSKNGASALSPLRTCEVRLEGVRSYSWVGFHFDAIANSEQQPFRLEISLDTDDPGTRADLYLFETKDFRRSRFHRAYHKYLRFGRGGELAYRIRVSTTT
ncbi:MAG: glycosyltransferase family 4 protein [Chloroflexi bacterium]|nr:glycosyltransferase family 4 protein [Chloroflexota bacterium]